nr:YfhD family protein [Salibacterium aidingense]
MGIVTRNQVRNNRHKKKSKLSQTPERDIEKEGLDVEYAEEFADTEDIEASERSRAADRRAHNKHKTK